MRADEEVASIWLDKAEREGCVRLRIITIIIIVVVNEREKERERESKRGKGASDLVSA